MSKVLFCTDIFSQDPQEQQHLVSTLKHDLHSLAVIRPWCMYCMYSIFCYVATSHPSQERSISQFWHPIKNPNRVSGLISTLTPTRIHRREKNEVSHHPCTAGSLILCASSCILYSYCAAISNGPNDSAHLGDVWRWISSECCCAFFTALFVTQTP